MRYQKQETRSVLANGERVCTKHNNLTTIVGGLFLALTISGILPAAICAALGVSL